GRLCVLDHSIVGRDALATHIGDAVVAVNKTPTILATETLLPKRNIAAIVARTRGIEAKASEVANVIHGSMTSGGTVRFESLSGNVPCMTGLPSWLVARWSSR